MTEIAAKVVLLDIEGTTTSISYVKDVLFPYTKQQAQIFLERNWHLDAIKSIVHELMQLPSYKEYLTEQILEQDVSVTGIAKFVNYLVDKDLKVTPLKTLQGLIWLKGYEDGTLKGHVYDDVPAAFKRWQQAGLSIAIYSSGSVAAQKLLFGYSILGNLLPHIIAHFDTKVGNKREHRSYENIARELNVPCADVVFLTDVIEEAAAAREAGMSVVILSRSGNAPLTDDQKLAYTVINDFKSLKLTPK